LSNIGTLLINSYNNNSGFVIHTNFNGIVTNFFDGLSSDLLEVDFSLSADFTEDHAD